MEEEKEDELAKSVELSDDGWGASPELNAPTKEFVDEPKQNEEAELSVELSDKGWGESP